MRKKRGKHSGLFIITIVVMTLTSCVDPIPFEAEDEVPKLVIFGTFTQLSQDHEVSVRLTGKFGSLGRLVKGASVVLIDEDGRRAQYHRKFGKHVLPKGIMEGEPGKAYKLEVTLLYGEKYESTWEVMPEPVQIGNTYYDIVYKQTLSDSDVTLEQFFIDVFIDTPIWTQSGNKAFLRWEVEETYSLWDFECRPWPVDFADVCYFEVENKFSQINLFSSIDDSQKKLEKHLVHSRQPNPYVEFNNIHYFNVFQYSLSESTYEYWNKINVVSNPTGSIFDKIPADVPGNISKIGAGLEVLGYFEVTAASVGRVFTTYDKIREKIFIPKECPKFYNPLLLPDYCCYCNLLPSKILSPTYYRIPKPDYWGE
ncbi:MAG: DUF4249 domain-containing protein [Bacteroidetes bacterium]|nr:DUF4249 domain-containing protein [Bacteroidota bacterium]